MRGLGFSLEPLVERTLWLDEVESTNQVLAKDAEGHQSVLLATWNQRSGRGRMGRSWKSPAGGSLALSLRLWPELTPENVGADWLGALSLISGYHLSEAISPEISADVSVKWPNDVEIDGLKVAGILGELSPTRAVVLGVGLNVWLAADQLPTNRATSLSLCGLSDDAGPERIVRRFLGGLKTDLPDIHAGLTPRHIDAISRRLATLGQAVRVDYPDASSRTGTATGLDYSGRLLVHFVDTGAVETVNAADVWHLRPDSP